MGPPRRSPAHRARTRRRGTTEAGPQASRKGRPWTGAPIARGRPRPDPLPHRGADLAHGRPRVPDSRPRRRPLPRRPAVPARHGADTLRNTNSIRTSPAAPRSLRRESGPAPALGHVAADAPPHATGRARPRPDRVPRRGGRRRPQSPRAGLLDLPPTVQRSYGPSSRAVPPMDDAAPTTPSGPPSPRPTLGAPPHRDPDRVARRRTSSANAGGHGRRGRRAPRAPRQGPQRPGRPPRRSRPSPCHEPRPRARRPADPAVARYETPQRSRIASSCVLSA